MSNLLFLIGAILITLGGIICLFSLRYGLLVATLGGSFILAETILWKMEKDE